MFQPKSKSLHKAVIKRGIFLSLFFVFFFFFPSSNLNLFFCSKWARCACIVRMAELCRVVSSYAATYGSDYSPVFIRPHWGTDCAAEQSTTSLTHYFNFSAKTFFGNPTRDSLQQQCVIIPRSTIISFLLNNGLHMHWFSHNKVSLHVLASTRAYVKQVDAAWVGVCGADTFKNEIKSNGVFVLRLPP